MVQTLTRNGFEVLEAAEGREALRLASQSPPDLILCDVEMPGMDGYEVLTALQRDTRLADIPMIFLTGNSEPCQIRQGMNLGADDYLTKPVSPPDLIGAIRARLHRWRSEQKRREQRARSGENVSFLVKTSREKRLVNISEIRSILACGPYSCVYWNKSGNSAMLRKPLKQWLRELPAERFIQVHRRAIVNLDFMVRIESLPAGGMRICVRDTPQLIPVSLRLVPVLNRKLKALRGR